MDWFLLVKERSIVVFLGRTAVCCHCFSQTLTSYFKTRRSWRQYTSPPVPPPGELHETYIRVVFDSVLFLVLYETMTSSTKPDIHNVSHCCQERIKPRQQTDRYTDHYTSLITILRSIPYEGEVQPASNCSSSIMFGGDAVAFCAAPMWMINRWTATHFERGQLLHLIDHETASVLDPALLVAWPH